MTRTAGKDHVSVDRLLEDLQAVVADAEALLKATSHQAGEKVQEARAKAEESLSAAREHLVDAQEGVLHQARELLGDARNMCGAIPGRPWASRQAPAC